MLGVRIDFEFLPHRLAQLRLGQHSFDCQFDHAFGILRQHLFRRYLAQPARVKRVVSIDLAPSSTLQPALRADHDNVITHA